MPFCRRIRDFSSPTFVFPFGDESCGHCDGRGYEPLIRLEVEKKGEIVGHRLAAAAGNRSASSSALLSRVPAERFFVEFSLFCCADPLRCPADQQPTDSQIQKIPIWPKKPPKTRDRSADVSRQKSPMVVGDQSSAPRQPAPYIVGSGTTQNGGHSMPSAEWEHRRPVLERSPSAVRRNLASLLGRLLPQRRAIGSPLLGRRDERPAEMATSKSLPTTPVAARNSGMRRLDSWIAGLLRDGTNGSVQSNSTPSTPIISNRPSFNAEIPTASTEPTVTTPSRVISGATTQHNHLPPPYASNRSAAPISRTASTESQRTPWDPPPNPAVGFRSPPPFPPRGAARFDDDFLNDVVPPRPPRQQIIQRSGSTGSSSRAVHFPNPKENRANMILQQLRADDGAQSESDVSTNEPPIYRAPQRPVGSMNPASKGVVYLEFNKEVKRSALPARLYSFEQIKSLFLRSFPNLSLQHLNQEHVKIYVADRHGAPENALFYELEDLNDVRDQTLLRIHQNTAGYRSPPPPVRFTDLPPTDYISEPEIEERTKRFNNYGSRRPASAVPGDHGRMQSAQSKAKATSNHFEPYYDPYYSDASSQGPRSGSVTPVIDKETKFFDSKILINFRSRVENMELQLAGLSSLVRTALHKKPQNESPDMLDLGRRLLEMHSDSERLGLSASADSDTLFLNGKHLINVRKGVQNVKLSLNELRELLQMDQQNRRDVIGDTFLQIDRRLRDFIKSDKIVGIDAVAEKRQQHQQSVKALEEQIQALEEQIEERRANVLSKNHKLRMAEVEDLQKQLNETEKQIAQIREKYSNMESEVYGKIEELRSEISRSTDFLKREPLLMESCGRRCGALANMLATMRKLALVQDPAMFDRAKSQLGKESEKPPRAKPNGVGPKNANEKLPPLPSSPQRNRLSPTQPIRSPPNSNVLDSILDELNQTANTLNGGEQKIETTATFTLKDPNQSAERYDNIEEVPTTPHVNDPRKHFTTATATFQQNPTYGRGKAPQLAN